MRENNDVELATLVRDVQKEAGDLDRVMRDRGPNAVLTVAAKIEHAARKLGWRALELTK